MTVMEKMKELGAQMGRTLSSRPYEEAKKLWESLPTAQRGIAKEGFYKSAEYGYSNRATLNAEYGKN